MHQTALNGKLAPREVILVAGSFYFRGICIWQMREAVPRQPASIPGGVRGWLLFPKHLGLPNRSAKCCCYYPDAKITDLVKFCRGPSLQKA